MERECVCERVYMYIILFVFFSFFSVRSLFFCFEPTQLNKKDEQFFFNSSQHSSAKRICVCETSSVLINGGRDGPSWSGSRCSG